LYGTGFGGPSKCNMLTGTSQSISPLLAYPGEVFRHDWTIPVAFSLANKHAFYFANQYLWQTTDGGETWEKISPDLSREHPGIPSNLDPTTAADTTYDEQTAGPRWGVIYTIAPSPLQADTLWAGTDDGLIWVTRDDGKHWRNVTPESVTPWSKVIMVDASHFDANIAYAAIDRHRLNDYKPHLLRTRDGGKTWHEVDEGLPSDAYVQAIKQDPGRKGMLWAGTSIGVYVSFDRGDHWQSLWLNMPPVEIRDFAFHNNSVAIATFGRGLWVLDDLNSLHQMDEKIADSSAYLFKPEPATLQVRGRGFDRGAGLAAATDMDPIEVWSGEPRMKGAIIDYYLKSEAGGPITLDILDAADKVVRHYSSGTKFPEENPKKMDVPAVWRSTPAMLPSTAGMHRFAWDLRDVPPDAPKLTGIAAFFGGRAALPGQYTVRLTVRGTTYSQPLTVNVPSVVKYDQANREAQVQVLGRIQALQIKVEAAEHEAEQVHKELASLGTRARGSVASSIRTAEKKVRDIQGYAAPPGPDTSGEGAATPAYSSLEGLGATLATMSLAAQQGGMGPPKQALRTGVDKTEKTADVALAAWGNFKSRDLERLDARLREAHLPEMKL
ncbi:MAG: WD40/YVTN/BNR-like repeat-containing protein, partial [Steroidobacteraceae bacterium]